LGIPDVDDAAPTARGKALTVGRIVDSLDPLSRADIAYGPVAEIVQTTPFPVSQRRRTFLQDGACPVEGVFLDLGGGQPDAGHIGPVFFGLLGVFGLFLF